MVDIWTKSWLLIKFWHDPIINMTHKLDLVSDTSFLNFMGDDFLRLLMCRHIFASCVLRAHRSFRGRGATFQVWSLTHFFVLSTGQWAVLPSAKKRTTKDVKELKNNLKWIWTQIVILASLWCFISRGQEARHSVDFWVILKAVVYEWQKSKRIFEKTYLQKLLSKIRFKLNVTLSTFLTALVLRRFHLACPCILIAYINDHIWPIFSPPPSRPYPTWTWLKTPLYKDTP